MNVWIFADFIPISEKKWKILENIKPHTVVLGVINQATLARYSYSKTTILKEARRLKEMGINVVYMVWIRRNKSFIKKAGQLMTELCDAEKPASILFDAEKHFHNGSISVEDALALIIFRFPNDIRWGLTGLARLQKSLKEFMKILGVCDYVLPQCYAIWKPVRKNHWSHINYTEPKKIIDIGYRTWYKENKYKKDLVMGLNIYWGKRPQNTNNPMSEGTCFKKCIEEAEKLGITDVAYWSLNHLSNRPMRQAFLIAIQLPSESKEISAIQWLLYSIGYDLGEYGINKNGIDGCFGEKTKKALNLFRNKYHIESDSLIPTKEDFIQAITVINDFNQNVIVLRESSQI